MNERRPLIYHRIAKSELISRTDLDHVYDSLYSELKEQHSNDNSSSFISKQLLTQDNDFELNSNFDIETSNTDLNSSDPKNDNKTFDFSSTEVKRCLFEYEIEELLPRRLHELGLINQWQMEQLFHSRIRFSLGKYRIVDFIGLGGYGQVFLGRSKTDPVNIGLSEMAAKRKTDVAIKVLPLKRSNPETIVRFLQEIQFVGRLNHSNIVQLIDYSKDANVYYAVYEYLDGGDVRNLITKNEKLPPQMAAYIVSEVAKSLQYLHEKRGIIHRDIKPGNILLSKKGKVKLIDFGLSVAIDQPSFSMENQPDEFFDRFSFNEHSFEYQNNNIPNSNSKWDKASLTKSSDSKENCLDKENDVKTNEKVNWSKKKVVGTPDYLSPDQIRNPQEPSPLWDIYSLGCTLYYMVTGIVPFPSGDSIQKIQAQLRSDPPEPRMFNSNLSQEMSNLIMQMMAKKKEDRVQTVANVIQRLSPWVPRFDEANSIILEIMNNSNLEFWTPEYFDRLNQLSSEKQSQQMGKKTSLSKTSSKNIFKNLFGKRSSTTHSSDELPLDSSEIPPVLNNQNYLESLESINRPFHNKNESNNILSKEEDKHFLKILGGLILIIIFLVILIFYFYFQH